MDHIKQQQLLHGLPGFKQPRSWKFTLRVLLPVTTLSAFLFACFSIAWSPSILNCIGLFSPSLPFDAFIDRKAMFLFCNVILMFLARDSGLLGSYMPESGSIDSKFVRRKGQHQQQGHCSAEIRLQEEGEEEIEKASGKEIVVKMEEKTSVREIILEEEEAHEEGECMGIQSLDELNKRCDEFIERMNRARRLEALQLVLG